MKKTIRLLFYLILLTLPLGQFSRIPLPTALPDINIYLNDVLLPILIILWLGYKMGVQKSLKLPPFWGWLAAFVGITGISLLNGLRWVSVSQWLVGSFYLIRWVEYTMLYWVVYDLFKRREIGERRVIGVMIGAIGVFAAAGLLQFIFFPDFSKYVQHGWDPHYYRVLSTFFDPNFAGIFLVMGVFLIISIVLGEGVEKRYKEKKKNLFYGLVVLLILVAILLTFSRSTYLALVVGIGVMGFLRSRRLLIIFLILAVLSILFIPRVRTRVQGILQPDVTAQLRIEDWLKTAKIVQDNWFLGVGFNTFRYAQERYGFFRDVRGVPQPSGHAGAGADSSFLFLWATTGIFGLLVYLGMLGNFWLRAYQKRGIIPLALTAIIPAWVVHAQFVNSLFYPWVVEFVWILIALL